MNIQRHSPGWPSAAALAAAVLALPSQAAPLTLVEALRLAEYNAPSLAAEQAKLQAASSAAIPAGELPDPQLRLGIQNYPVGGPDRWSIDRDFMTMQMVGVMQEVPNRAKRQARVEVAEAAVERAAADGTVERLNVRLATALAWIDRLAVERQMVLFAEFIRENRLLAAAVQAQIAGGRGQTADAVRPKQEAARLAEQQDELAQLHVRARAALRRWIGMAADRPLAGDWPQWSVEHTRYSHQLPRHPALAVFEPMTREAQAKVREAQAEKKSDWSWELDYQRRGREFGDMVGVQVSFDLPLFPGSRQDPKIAARHAELNQLEAEREALLREHAQQLEEDLADYQRLKRALQRNSDSFVPLAREKGELSLASYRAGKGDLLGVIAARQELIEARLRQVELEAQRARTGARLYFSYGEERP
ncbi:Outer membrane protein TolC [Geopseudomonas sagittaria]|uniref:Outer membrane protein TolC n=1 Tax=Geopseudomonas sagittaria TaxID=1135990 RepID=A0A1I5X9C7_9GAMM|nr:TolC family protein [Pseudomonas sagittaria]MCM2331427.1 TolC family protein [Pseudomonas sagittaria]SFQ28575.1 Outer membrane protein TolC [Pseudomonas sagittaria]